MDIKDEILMEAGTNELEILVFKIETERFGMNIAKVREVIRMSLLTAPPLSHPMLEGVMNLRDHILPVINLRRALGYTNITVQKTNCIVVTEFHQQWFGFIVDGVHNIYRISWKDIEPPGEHSRAECLTGIAHVNDGLVLMLDVEKIAQPLMPPQPEMDKTKLSDSHMQIRAAKRILIADDSGVMRSLVQNKLTEAGYTNITSAKNGEEAWKLLQKSELFDLVITDIEMPRIDGLHLTKLIKTNDKYRAIPVLIFSSIISDDNRKKGESVGADDQFSKPDIVRLVETLDRFLKIS